MNKEMDRRPAVGKFDESPLKKVSEFTLDTFQLKK